MANSYSASTSIYKQTVCGIPVTTFTATCISLGLYLLVAVFVLTLDCPFDRNVTYFFIFVMLAMIALCTMAGINMMYTRYRFNCLSLTVSLLYSGSAALITYSLISSAIEGLCNPNGTSPSPPLFVSKHVGNYLIWFSSLTALAFQIVAHYFYG